jgi:hypothetical protein
MTAATPTRPARHSRHAGTGRQPGAWSHHGDYLRRPHRIAEPVFPDRTGRRRRVVATAGAVGALLLTLMLLALLAGFTGAGRGSMPDLPAAAARRSPSVGSGEDRIEPSPSATSQAAVTGRPSLPPSPAPGAGPAREAGPAGTRPGPSAAAPTTSPAPTPTTSPAATPPTSPAATATTSPAATPMTSATPTGNVHRRVPTQTPGPHASQGL